MNTPAVNAIDRLAADDFAPFIGKAFRPDGADLELILTTVERSTHRGWETAPRQPFSLLLRGPRDRVLPEGLYRWSIEGGPALPLYVIPILTAARDHQDYQIVFN